MKLRLVSPHLSIKSLNEIEVPDLTPITGPNGSGKTHLLRAIANGNVLVDEESFNESSWEVRFFNWSNLMPSPMDTISSSAQENDIEHSLNRIQELTANPAINEHLRLFANKINIELGTGFSVIDLCLISSHEIVDLIPAHPDKELFAQNLTDAQLQLDNNILASFGNLRRFVEETANRCSKRLPLLTRKDFLSANVPNFGNNEAFEESFSHSFLAYRNSVLKNDLAEFRSQKRADHGEFLDQTEFEALNGIPPWDFVNSIISQANLPFAFDPPDADDFSKVTPTLRKIGTNEVIQFHELSSGEKILLALAFSVYAGTDTRMGVKFPKLLLLDEIDAPLHPSMSKALIETITTIFVEKFGVKVIATTHSPSTVALAEEKSLFVMQSNPTRLRKTTKAEALNVLTAGVPTVAISHEGRRQVFVESPIDADVYTNLYSILKGELNSSRSLEFIATGGTTNVGCDVVKRLVRNLTSAGNQSIFGLVDYDGKNASTQRLKVLGGGNRDGIENYLLDPILLILLVSRERLKVREQIGINLETPHPIVLGSTPAQFQNYVAALESILFDINSVNHVESAYLGGLKIQIDKQWINMDDHALEDLILKKLPELHSVRGNKAGQLLKRVVTCVLSDSIDFTPVEVFETFKVLLDENSHI